MTWTPKTHARARELAQRYGRDRWRAGNWTVARCTSESDSAGTWEWCGDSPSADEAEYIATACEFLPAALDRIERLERLLECAPRLMEGCRNVGGGVNYTCREIAGTHLDRGMCSPCALRSAIDRARAGEDD